MPRWLRPVLTRTRELALARKVLFTLKARRELASLAFGLDEQDACDVLANLPTEDSAGRLASASNRFVDLVRTDSSAMRRGTRIGLPLSDSANGEVP